MWKHSTKNSTENRKCIDSKKKKKDELRMFLTLIGVAQLVECHFSNWKSPDSSSGHMPGLRVCSPLRAYTGGNCQCFSPPLPLSLSPSLKQKCLWQFHTALVVTLNNIIYALCDSWILKINEGGIMTRMRNFWFLINNSYFMSSSRKTQFKIKL